MTSNYSKTYGKGQDIYGFVTPSGGSRLARVPIKGEGEDVAETLTYDYIIVGGGTAGALIAARLAQNDPTKTILILEAGPDNSRRKADQNTYERGLIDTPAFFQFLYSKFLPDPNRPGEFMTPSSLLQLSNEKDDYADQIKEVNRRIFYPRGAGAGGSVAHHAMVHGRGSANPYDNWSVQLNETVYNKKLGKNVLLWSKDDVEAYQKDQEVYYDDGDNASKWQEPTYDLWSASTNYNQIDQVAKSPAIVSHNGSAWIQLVASGPGSGGPVEPGTDNSKWIFYDTIPSSVHNSNPDEFDGTNPNFQAFLAVRKMQKIDFSQRIAYPPDWVAGTYKKGDIRRDPTTKIYYESLVDNNTQPLTNPLFWARYAYTPMVDNSDNITDTIIRNFRSGNNADPDNHRFYEDPANRTSVIGWHIGEAHTKPIPNSATKTSGFRSNCYEDLLQYVLNSNGNVTIKYDACVERVILDENNQAVGVVVMEAPFHQEFAVGGDKIRDVSLGFDAPDGTLHAVINQSKNTPVETVFFNNQEVIITAGAQISPQLLMLSGIGPKQTLEENNIPVKVQSEKVGKELLDHLEGTMAFNMDPTKIIWKWQATFLKTLNKKYYSGLTDLCDPFLVINVSYKALDSYTLSDETDPIQGVVYGSGGITGITGTGGSFTLNNTVVTSGSVILLTNELLTSFNGLYLVVIAGANVTLTKVYTSKTMIYATSGRAESVYRIEADNTITELTAIPTGVKKQPLEDHKALYCGIKKTIDYQADRVLSPVEDVFERVWDSDTAYDQWEIVKYGPTYYRAIYSPVPAGSPPPNVNPTYWGVYDINLSPSVTYYKGNFVYFTVGGNPQQKYIVVDDDNGLGITGQTDTTSKYWAGYTPGDVHNPLGTNAIPAFWEPSFFDNINALDGVSRQNTGHCHVIQALFIDFATNYHGTKPYNSIVPGIFQPDGYDTDLQESCFCLPSNNDMIIEQFVPTTKAYNPGDIVWSTDINTIFKCLTPLTVPNPHSPIVGNTTAYWQQASDFTWLPLTPYSPGDIIKYNHTKPGDITGDISPTEMGFTIYKVLHPLGFDEDPSTFPETEAGEAKVEILGVKTFDQTVADYDTNWNSGSPAVGNNKLFKVFSQLYPENSGSYVPGVFLSFLNENVIMDFEEDPKGYITINSRDIRDKPILRLNLTDNETIMTAFSKVWQDVRRGVFLGTTLSNGTSGERTYGLDPNYISYYLKPDSLPSSLAPESNYPSSPEVFPGEDKNTVARLTDYMRKWSNYGHHISGTCKMGTNIENGVVDSHCRVFGAKNLRVCDTSVANKVFYHAYNTSMLAYTVADRVADLIIDDNQ